MAAHRPPFTRIVLTGLLVASAAATPRARGAAPDSIVKVVAAKVGGPVKWEAQCDPGSKVELFTATHTGHRHLAMVDGARVTLSQPLTGRHASRGRTVGCSPAVGELRPRDDGYCVSACARGPGGLRYYYARYYDFTRQETAEGRTQYWFDVRYRDGAFLTRSVSRLVSSNLALGSGWEIWRFRENADYESRRFVSEFGKATVGGDDPGFEAEALPVVARGPILVAGPEFDSKQAFSEFQVVHGKAGWKGAADLSASAQAKWRKDGLSFRVFVKDDAVVTGSGIGNDHVEVWFAHSLLDVGGQGTRTKASQVDTQVLVSIVDGKVVGAVSSPKDRAGPLALDGSFQAAEDGYVLEFRIPAEPLFPGGRPPWSDLDDASEKSFVEGDLLPFTLVVSDADVKGKQKALLATSALKWGNPTTFGRILLSGKHGLPELNRMQAKEEL